MLRISLCYITFVILFSVFSAFMTLKYPNYLNQFGNDFKIEIISK